MISGRYSMGCIEIIFTGDITGTVGNIQYRCKLQLGLSGR